MKEQLVEFQTAELAKEKGFNIDCEYFYGSNENELYADYGNNKHFKKWCTAPTQSLLQKWLREEYDLHIHFSTTVDNEWSSRVIEINEGVGFSGTVGRSPKEMTGDTYEQALEKGLQAALEMI